METSSKSHIGRKISRIRELKGMKQEVFADALGVSQQAVSGIENSEEIDDRRLRDIAKALGFSAEAVKNFSEENAINYFNTFYDNSAINGQGAQYPVFNFNPIEKLVQVFGEKEKLYERLLEAEKEKNSYLEKLLNR